MLRIGAAAAATAASGNDGAYGASLAFASRGVVQVTAVAMPGTVAETTGPAVEVLVGPGELTFNGPSTASRGMPTTFNGALTLVGAPLGSRTVETLVNGVASAASTTAANGGYSAAVTFTKRGLHTVREVAFRGTPAETLSAPRNVAVDIFTQVASGEGFTCGLKADGTVWCWGRNNLGQLGDGTGVDRTAPVQVLGVQNAHHIAAGDSHACALKGGYAVCWGNNVYGQLGAGGIGGAYYAPMSTQVLGPNGPNAIRIVAGSHHTCAVTGGATVWCWGANFYGQLGLGDTNTRSVPTEVPGMSTRPWEPGLATGSVHTCVNREGTLYCWGANFNGQLGLGDQTTRYTPTVVPGVNGAAEVRAGGQTTCVRFSSGFDAGRVWCWGLNTNGQVGVGSSAISFTQPQVVSGISTSATLTVGSSHACAGLTGGTMRCWGSNANGQLGDGTLTDRSSPVAVAGLPIVATADPGGNAGPQISAGYDHTCARLLDGNLRCWGSGGNGRLGNGGTTLQSTPVEVL